MFQTGDIIFTSRRSIIVRFMRIFQKDPVYWGHVLVAKNERTAWEAGYTLREVPIPDKLDKTNHYKIVRPAFLTESCKNVMVESAPSLLGNYYSVWRIILQACDHLFHTDWFTSKNEKEKSQVCSSYAAWIYNKACGYKFNGVDWQSCDPDDIDDDVEKYPDRWSVLAERKIY